MDCSLGLLEKEYEGEEGNTRVARIGTYSDDGYLVAEYGAAMNELKQLSRFFKIKEIISCPRKFCGVLLTSYPTIPPRRPLP